MSGPNFTWTKFGPETNKDDSSSHQHNIGRKFSKISILSNPYLEWLDFEDGETLHVTPYTILDLELLTSPLPDGIGLSHEFVSEVIQAQFGFNKLDLLFALAADFSILDFMLRLTPSIYQKHHASIQCFLDLGQLQREISPKTTVVDQGFQGRMAYHSSSEFRWLQLLGEMYFYKILHNTE